MTSIGRRQFLAGAGAAALAARPAFAGLTQAAAMRPGAVFPASVRDDFPAAALETYLNAGAVHPLGRFAAKAIQEGVAFRLQGAGPGRADFNNDRQADLKKRFGAADQRQPERDRLHLEHLRRREHRRDGDGPGEEEGQHRHRRAALHQLPLPLQGAGEAGRRAAHRQAPQLGDRPGRHGQGHRPQHADGLAGAGLERQRLHARLQGGRRPGPRPRRLRVRRHHPGGRRGAGRRQGAGHRLRRHRHLQVDHGRTRLRLPLRERGAAGHGAADDALRPSPGQQLQPRRAHLGAAARRGALRDRRHRRAARGGGVRGHRLRQRPRPRQDPRARHAADRSPARPSCRRSAIRPSRRAPTRRRSSPSR